MKKFLVSRCRVCGRRFRPDADGKIHRRFLTGQAAAKALAAQLRGENLTVEARVAALPREELTRLIFIHDEAQEKPNPFSNPVGHPIQHFASVLRQLSKL